MRSFYRQATKGLAFRQGTQTLVVSGLLRTLRDRELALAGNELQQRTGKTWRQVQNGQVAQGIYLQTLQLVSGRFVVLDDLNGFSLVPWRKEINQRLGHYVSAVMRDSPFAWEFRKQKSISV